MHAPLWKMERLCYRPISLTHTKIDMADKPSSKVPFELDDEDDVFTSAEYERTTTEIRTSSQFQSIQPQDTGPVHTAPRTTGGQAAVQVPQLTVQTSAGTKQVPLSKSPFTVGLEDADLPIQDPFVDRWHAVLRIEGNSVVVEDMGSLNGVFLRIADDLPLEDRDQIAMGHQRFELRTTWDPVPAVAKSRSAMPAGGKVPTRGARLIQWLEGGRIGHVFRIGDSLSIGCTPNNSAFIEDDSLSTLHATIQRSANGYTIKNVSSTGGTFIRIYDPVELISGDCFLVGTSLISVQYP